MVTLLKHAKRAGKYNINLRFIINERLRRIVTLKALTWAFITVVG
ncbi:hypothetical protein HMPREF0742_02009 [Rothia aeria F0184]|uniref:Uncharacterized protein n=1 Tax=Rothia aeria F0184 TaxID=888019 RepID=U7V1D2_9MICC|nr:hypothetical protein HMPREF0742_02009 [Rothia aeria F0184]